MLASFLLWRAGDGYYMQLPTPILEPVRRQLSRYILRAKVKVDDASREWELFGVAGPDAARRVASAGGTVPTQAMKVSDTGGIRVIRLPGDRFEIVASNDRAPEVRAALTAGTASAASESWELEEIRAGIPSILPPTQEAFVPQMVNLDLVGGVSFDKGCYPGQEIVARMHYRGTLKQRMYRAGIAGSERPQPGDKLYSANFGEQACGTIVNAAPVPGGGFDALAVIQIAVAKGDVRWQSTIGPPLTLLPLPYPLDPDR